MPLRDWNVRGFSSRWDRAIQTLGGSQQEQLIEVDRGEFTWLLRSGSFGVCLIRSGYFKLETVREEVLRVVRICGQDELVGYGGWLLEGTPEYRLTALSHGLLSFYPKEEILRLQAVSTDVNAMVIEMLCRTIFIKDERIMALEQTSARDRVKSLLYSLARKFGEKTPEGILITVPVERPTLAMLASVANESLSRILTDLAEDGIIVKRRRKIIIPDLRRIASRGAPAPLRLADAKTG